MKYLSWLFILFVVHAKAQRFAVIGDYGCDCIGEQQVADLVRNHSPDFIITTGDNNYPKGSSKTIDQTIGKYFHDYIYPYKGKYGTGSTINRFFPSLGNHDLMRGYGRAYRNYFKLPGNERYYDTLIGNVHLFILNSNPRERHGTHSNSRQALWLKSKLKESNARWKIVVAHHAPYASDAAHEPAEWMRWPFKEWGADIMFNGHAHVYERATINDFTYVVNGLGGSGRYSFGENTYGSIRYNENYGAVFCNGSNEKLEVSFINVSGQLIDTFQLKK